MTLEKRKTSRWLSNGPPVLVAALCLITASHAAAISSNQTTTVPAIDPSQYKRLISPGIGNTLPGGQPIISVDKNLADWNRPVPSSGLSTLPMRPIGPELCYLAGGLATIDMCGVAVRIPAETDDMKMTGMVTFTMPPPFAPAQKIIMQCFLNSSYPNKNGPQYQLIVTDSSTVTCALQKCSPSNVSVCGASIPVPIETVINKSTDIPLPSALLADPSAGPNSSLTVRCVDDDQGNPVYRAMESSEISCNLFPCPDTVFELCGVSVPVKGGLAMGAVLNQTMPPPFAPDPFTVQCVGNGDYRPTYQLTDHSVVTCKTAIPIP
jgi:hypothetical protein